MRVLFLDFDGVLNSRSYFDRCPACDRSPGADHTWLDPEAVSRLNVVARESKALVVVSSAWRIGRTVPELQAILSARGFSGEVIGKTPDLEGSRNADGWIEWVPRGREIEAWMSGLPVESFAVLDDCGRDEMAPVSDRLVQTDWVYGLRDEEAAMALDLLSRPL